MDKINKYIKKFNGEQNQHKNIGYLRKIAHYVALESNNIKGGGHNQTKSNKLYELLSYLDNKIKESRSTTVATTKNKYFIFLYGPPASGKSIARKIACGEIANSEFSNGDTPLVINNRILSIINNTFVDTGVDEIVYEFADDKL